MRTGLKIVGITCAAIAVIGGGMYAAAKTLDTTKTSDTSVERSIDRIVVKVDSGDIEFVRGGRNVEIHETKSYVLDSPDVTRTIDDGVLTIESECDGVLSIVCETDFRIEVPKDVSVDARSYVGDIEIDGVAAPRVEARGYVGDIQVDVTRKSQIDAHTNVGDIDIEVPKKTYDADSVDARADVGSVDVAPR